MTGVLCEVDLFGSFFATWLAISCLALTTILVTSGSAFYVYYANPTYDTWKMKINPKYPSPAKVREEIVLMLKGMSVAALCPALSVYLSRHGLSKAYCGVEPYGWPYLIGSALVLILGSDLFEWFYHWLGHTTAVGWSHHKAHHQFFNPSPFSVIADEYVDQMIRASPLLFFPLLMPINIDMAFFVYGVFFYGYGVVLHWGHEWSWLDAHHPIINTSFQHYCHHARSLAFKPYHTGFFFKIWDQLAGSVWDKECFCVKCETAKGNRSLAKWEEAKKSIPDYSPLLKWSFWREYDSSKVERE